MGSLVYVSPSWCLVHQFWVCVYRVVLVTSLLGLHTCVRNVPKTNESTRVRHMIELVEQTSKFEIRRKCCRHEFSHAFHLLVLLCGFDKGGVFLISLNPQS